MLVRRVNRGTRRLAAVALGVLLVSALAACGGGSSSTQATKSTNPNVAASTTPSTSTPTPAKRGTGTTTTHAGGSKAKATPGHPAGKRPAQKFGRALQLQKLKKLHVKVNLGSLKSSLKKFRKAPKSVGDVNAGLAAVRACMRKQGIPLASGSKLPSGVSRARYQAALKACVPAIKVPSLQSKQPSHKGSAAKFVQCMRQNGIDMPAPNTSGQGPVLSTAGVDTGSEQFKAAMKACSKYLPSLDELLKIPVPAGVG